MQYVETDTASLTKGCLEPFSLKLRDTDQVLSFKALGGEFVGGFVVKMPHIIYNGCLVALLLVWTASTLCCPHVSIGS